MVKITFEVSEEMIREKSEFKNIVDNSGDDKGSAVRMLLQMIAFVGITKDIDEGKNEFVITMEKLGEKEMKLFDNCFDEVCLLAHFCDGVEENEKSK